jgi:hypothetical protein
MSMTELHEALKLGQIEKWNWGWTMKKYLILEVQSLWNNDMVKYNGS